MKRIISFSLWGSNKKYLDGAIKNVELAKKLYHGWTCRFYVSQSTPRGYVLKLYDFDNVEVMEMPHWGDFKSMFDRFGFFFDSDVDLALVRDCDSRLSLREKLAVEEWIENKKNVMTIIDHPYHQFSIMPGLSSFKKEVFPKFAEALSKFNKQDVYGTDYRFFHENQDLFKNDILIHDSIFGRGKDFPTERKELEFCGKVFDENEKTVLEHEQVLKNWLEKKDK